MAFSNTAPAKLDTQQNSESELPAVQSLSFYYKLITLYLLNIVDWLCTEALISSGRFYEANPFMKGVLEDFWLTLLIKGLLPFALVMLCAIIYRLMGAEVGKTANIILYIGLSVYAAINVWHILNFVLLFSVF